VSAQIDNFRNQLRTKVEDADKRLRDLETKVKASGEKAEDDAKAQLSSLETKVKAQQAKVQASETSMKTWVEEKKKVTSNKIAEWKAQRRVKELVEHANIAEDYAAAATEVAAAMIDEAEKAIAEAVVARMNADSVQSAPTAKSA
jgi:hypothetical protein